MGTEQRIQKTLDFLDTQEGQLVYWVNERKGVSCLDNLCGIIRRVCGELGAKDIFAVYQRISVVMKLRETA
jgi:hypothetical protein